MNPIVKLVRWYFSKRALPFWCIFLMDMTIVFISVLFTYWAFNRTDVMYEERINVLCSSLLYATVSAIGARAFRTYSGIVRYSSFVDLMKVAYANALSLLLALIVTRVADKSGVGIFTALNFEQTIIAFVVATLLMSFERIIVKSLYDDATSDSRALRVLIYGAHTGGIGLAKTFEVRILNGLFYAVSCHMILTPNISRLWGKRFTM